RYVKALKERGGWEAVNRAYRFPPSTTASILHPEGVSSIDLGPGKTRGEFAIIQMLTEHSETRPLAVRAAAGWRADRLIEDGPRKAWVIAFATTDAALRSQKALARLRTVQQPNLRSFLDEQGAAAWHGPAGEVVAVLTRGERVLMLDAPDDAAY